MTHLVLYLRAGEHSVLTVEEQVILPRHLTRPALPALPDTHQLGLVHCCSTSGTLVQQVCIINAQNNEITKGATDVYVPVTCTGYRGKEDSSF